jgi:hypothetical protein
MYPGFEHPGLPRLCPVKRPNQDSSAELRKLDNYYVFWRDPEDRDKGTIWILCSRIMGEAASIRTDKEIPFRLLGHRPSLVKARGKNWKAVYEDGSEYPFKASPQATKRIMADIATRWDNPPSKLKPGNGPPFRMSDLSDELASFVYLVRLLTFDETSKGEAYYKIGKAKSIPHRIKQFGPCTLVESICLGSEGESLRIESNLHAMFDHLRRPGTEIFCIHRDELDDVVRAFVEQKANKLL